MSLQLDRKRIPELDRKLDPNLTVVWDQHLIPVMALHYQQPAEHFLSQSLEWDQLLSHRLAVQL